MCRKAYAVPKFKFTIEYDGSKFRGWQRQAPPNDARTIQEELERALFGVFHEEVDVIGAGRTDAGVHARGQIAHVAFTRTDLVPEEIVRAMRGVLPHDIVVHAVEPVHDDFHARYDAVRRTYSYTVSPRRQAIGRTYAWSVGWQLDMNAMAAAAQSILGEHDFTAYSKENAEVKNRHCRIFESTWTPGGGLIRYVISGDRFVYSMVRALVGAMISVGRGRITPEEFSAILDSCDRARNKNALAPPHGLCLESVEYSLPQSVPVV